MAQTHSFHHKRRSYRLPHSIIPLLFTTFSLISHSAYSHGSLSNPPSRPYYCWLNPSHPACPGTQATITYDWNSAGRRCGAADFACNKTSPPPGTLCSGGKYFPGSEYYDVPRDYHRTDVQVGANIFEYHTTAEHLGTYYVYLSKDTTDLSREDITLSDFEQVCVYEYDDSASGKRQFPCTLPGRQRKEQLIYINWRTKITAPEQFMTCADVRLVGSGGGGNEDRDRSGDETRRKDKGNERRKEKRRRRRRRRRRSRPTHTAKPKDSDEKDKPDESKCAAMYEQCGGQDSLRRQVNRECCEGKCVGTQWWAACKPDA